MALRERRFEYNSEPFRKLNCCGCIGLPYLPGFSQGIIPVRRIVQKFVISARVADDMKLTTGILGILLGLCLVSCEWFVSRESKTRELVEQEMSSINWNEVDQFPFLRPVRKRPPSPSSRNVSRAP